MQDCVANENRNESNMVVRVISPSQNERLAQHNNQHENQQVKNPSTSPPMFSKKIGSTTYTVSVYHSQTSKETAEDKLLRLIENEVRRGA